MGPTGLRDMPEACLGLQGQVGAGGMGLGARVCTHTPGSGLLSLQRSRLVCLGFREFTLYW